jgi:aryl-alcohol dehydrogenase-like predicted oxidoreductase
MRQIPLGRTGLTVSDICLGTMTWGNRNTEAEGHAQIALALDHGVTFWDTAEMYPVAPIRPETVGATEAIIGTWFAARGGRDRVVLATKVTGAGMAAVRDGAPITPETIRGAVEGSLKRLQTDYIDLYQLHWPNRGSYHFRQIWGYRPKTDRAAVVDHIDAVLGCLGDLVAEGKIRAIGLSNESVWGAALWLARAEALGLPRMATVQNEYSLLCRLFDGDWAELSAMEDMPLLAFSPLACGMLSGKYQGDATPEGTRRAVTGDLGGRVTPRALAAVGAYLDIARRHGLNPCQMALAFCRQRPFPCIPIVGATSTDQLAETLATGDLRLSDEVLAEIAAAHRAHPMPF